MLKEFKGKLFSSLVLIEDKFIPVNYNNHLYYYYKIYKWMCQKQRRKTDLMKVKHFPSPSTSKTKQAAFYLREQPPCLPTPKAPAVSTNVAHQSGTSCHFTYYNQLPPSWMKETTKEKKNWIAWKSPPGSAVSKKRYEETKMKRSLS